MENGSKEEIHLPLGKDSFEKLQKENCYYIDKTGIIEELVSQRFEVSLITRPRRFGKTLMMSMLEDFFDIEKESREDFKGLVISENERLCAEWMNRWPVIFLTLKSVNGNNFEDAFDRLKILISDLCIKNSFLSDSLKVNPLDRESFRKLADKTADKADTCNALYLLTRMMCSHYGRQVILLIDEYDVPLAKASDYGYYDKMLDVIRALFDKVLKSNEFLKFAVVTGCLKIAKESVFTGTNNFVSDTITGDRFDEYIGFTESDIRRLLTDTGFADHGEEMKFWYNGYRFGTADIYCPWDVLNHVAALQQNPVKKPQSYWENTSHNNIIRRFIERTDLRREERIGDDFEILLSGGYIVKPITENLTYDMLHSSADNLWSLLYLTGYLTKAPVAGEAEQDDKTLALKIPNEEVRRLFKTTVTAWFKDTVRAADRTELFDALWGQDEEKCSAILTKMIFDTISYNDYGEDYYHAFVVGILSFAGYRVKSNYEEGEGRPDVVLKDEQTGRAMVIEIKRAAAFGEMEKGCREALKQIEDRRYAEGIKEEFDEVLGYGMCFYKKRCRVKSVAFSAKG